MSGTTIVIAVNIDFWALPKDDEFGKIKIETSVSSAQDAWNAALANLPFEGCFTIQVRFVAHVQNLLDKPEKGFHQIHPDVEHSGSSVVWDPGTKDATVDTTTAYNQDLLGYWYTDSLSETGWEHEIGHLMGLGDDYRLEDVQIGGRTYTVPVPLPGRGPTPDNPGGTLMAGGKTIDRNLADRVAKLARHAGMKLPPCNVWKGSIHIEASVVAPGASESGTGDGQVVLHEDSAGHLTGTVTVKRTKGCDAYPPYADTVVLNESGEDAQGRLTVNSTLVSPSPQSIGNGICGYPDGAIADFGEGPGGEPGGSPVLPFVIPKKSATSAEGTDTIVDVENFGNGSPITTIKFTYTIKLTRQTD